MHIAPSTEPGLHDVTFDWRETDPDRPAQAVLLRLVGWTSYAYDDGDLAPYLMRPAPGGVWTVTLRLPSSARSSYQICPIRDRDLADGVSRAAGLGNERWLEVLGLGEPDATNPVILPGGTTYGHPGPSSIVELPDAPAQPWRDWRVGAPRGGLTRYEIGEGGRPPAVVHVYRPVDGREPTDGLPLVILFDARFWLAVDVTDTLDNLIADAAVPPMVVVVVESIHGASRPEGLTHPDLFEPFLVDELVPWLRSQWMVRVTEITLAGQSLGGLTATYAALRHPDLFGRVVTSSMAGWWPGDGRGGLSGAEVIGAYRDGPCRAVRLFVEVGSAERDLLSSVRVFHHTLLVRGYDVRYREYEGGHDVACWRGGLADGLVALLGRIQSVTAIGLEWAR